MAQQYTNPFDLAEDIDTEEADESFLLLISTEGEAAFQQSNLPQWSIETTATTAEVLHPHDVEAAQRSMPDVRRVEVTNPRRPIQRDEVTTQRPRSATHTPQVTTPRHHLEVHRVEATTPQHRGDGQRASRTVSPATSRTRSNSDRSEEIRPTTKFTFIQQTPGEGTPQGQVTTIRKAVMKNYLRINNGDNRRKRPKRKLSDDSPAPESTPAAESSGHNKRLSRTDIRRDDAFLGSRSASDEDIAYERSVREEQEERAQIWRHVTSLLRNRVDERNWKRPMQMPRLNIERLGLGYDGYGSSNDFGLEKHEISRIEQQCDAPFARTQLTQHWLALLMGSRNAFYSPLCVSSVYDEILDRGLNNTPGSSLDSAAVRSRLMQMIFESTGQGDISHGQLISVLHIMYSELMSGNLQAIEVHREGIDQLVQINGGLANLGPDGLLARAVLCVMYMTSCVLETSPAQIYMLHASTEETEPPQPQRDVLDYPIYAATTFSALSQPTFKDECMIMLELCRRATSAFFTIHNMRDSRVARSMEAADDSLRQCHHNLLAFSQYQLHDPQQALCEVVRIACCIFVHALRYWIPLSRAVQDPELLENYASSRRPYVHILVQFQEALKASPFEARWEAKEKVLLWCGLVASAAASPVLREESLDSDNAAQKRSRDFIAAVTLRTAVFQMFGAPQATLGMLKRFVMIQGILADRNTGKVLPSREVPGGSGGAKYGKPTFEGFQVYGSD